MKMAVFWVIAPCNLVEVLIALMMEAVSISETSANFYQTTRRNNPEDSHLDSRRRENLKSRPHTALHTRNNTAVECQCWKETFFNFVHPYHVNVTRVAV
jgi:hypothetical protein